MKRLDSQITGKYLNAKTQKIALEQAKENSFDIDLDETFVKIPSNEIGS